MPGNKGSRKQKHRKISTQQPSGGGGGVNGNGGGQVIDKEKSSAAAQPVNKDSSVANLTSSSKPQAQQAAASASNGNDVKQVQKRQISINTDCSRSKKKGSKQQQGAYKDHRDSVLQKKEAAIDNSNNDQFVQDNDYKQAAPLSLENSDPIRPSEVPAQQLSASSKKAKPMFGGSHKQKSSAIKISPTQVKGQKLDKIKTGPQPGGGGGGIHHSSFAQHKDGNTSVLNSNMNGYYVNGQNFQIHLTQTPVVIKSKHDALMGSSVSYNASGGHILHSGQPLGAATNFKTPYIASTVKSQALDQNGRTFVNGHLASEFEGILAQQSASQQSQGLFNSHSKNKQALTSFTRGDTNKQFTPRRLGSGVPVEDGRKMAAAYFDNQKSSSSQAHKKHNLNAVLVQNSYYNKVAGGLMCNPQLLLNQEMMIQGKNASQMQNEINKVQMIKKEQHHGGAEGIVKQQAQSQDARPQTGQDEQRTEASPHKQTKSRLESGPVNKSTHILLPHKEQQQMLQQQNVRAMNRIGLSKYVQKNRNNENSSNTLVMSAPRVVALAGHHGVSSDAGQQQLYMHIDDKDSVKEVQSTVKALNQENYKSLQVNRSNTTTGYIAGGGKTQVQLSQHLQHPPNYHLTNNGMSILANGAPPPNIPNIKQSHQESETQRLRREQSDNVVGATRVQLSNKNQNVSKLVSNFKVHQKKSNNTTSDDKNARAGAKQFGQKRHSVHQEYPDVVPIQNHDQSRDYPTSNPSRNQNRKIVGAGTQKIIDNSNQVSLNTGIISGSQGDNPFQIQPTIVFSVKPNANQIHAGNMNTVDDEIFQNNGRQITEGYNSLKRKKLLTRELPGMKSKPTIGSMVNPNHQINMQLFEMQFLKGQENSMVGMNGPLYQQNVVSGQSIPWTKDQIRMQQSRSPSKGGLGVHPKASLPQTQMLKSPAFGGYSHNASKPNNLIYSVHHHMQNVQDPLNGTMLSQKTVNSTNVSAGAQTYNGVLLHKPTNSTSFLGLQSQTSSTVRQDQLILSNALQGQQADNGIGTDPQSREKKMVKLRSGKDISGFPAHSQEKQDEKIAAALQNTLHNQALQVQQMTSSQMSNSLITQHKSLAKADQKGSSSNTQLSGPQKPIQSKSTNTNTRIEDASHLLQMSLLQATGGAILPSDLPPGPKGVDTLQLAIQNLQSEQENVVADIFQQNKHIDPNSLNLIIQSQLSQIKQQQTNSMGQKFVTNIRGGVAIQGNNMNKQAAQQADMLAHYKTQLEGLQALKNLQDFLEFSANQNVSQIIQNRSKFLMQGGFGGAAIPSYAKQFTNHPKKPPTDLYGNPIALDKKPKIPFENAYVEDCYKYIVLPGNNSQLIRKALERRSWWIEIQPVHSLFNFKWQPVSHGIRFDRLSARQPKHGENYGMGAQVTTFNTTMGGGPPTQNEHSDSQQHKAPTLSDLNSRQVVNHVEHHSLLTEKFNLLHSMQKYCDLNKENVFDFLPVTFYIEMPNIQKENAYNAAMQPFLQYFQVLEEHKVIIHELKQELVKLQEREEERERLMAEQKEQENEDGDDDSQSKQKKEDGAAGSESDTGAEGEGKRQPTQEEGLLDDGEAGEGIKKEDEEDQEGGRKKEKGLLSSQPGYSTVYKTPGKENPNNKSTKFKSFNFEKRNHMKLTCPLSHFDGHNLWLLKPTHLNRGRGIHVFNDVATLHKLMREYCIGKDEESWKKKSKIMTEKNTEDDQQEKLDELPHGLELEGQGSHMDVPTDSPLRKSTAKLQREPDSANAPIEKKPTKSGCNKIKHNTFIIQKYIERPLLICGRKFDIRVWVLLDQDHNLHFFKEGYIRTSASIFSIDSEHIDNAAVHLTNNAVQKALDSYGQFEDGNQLSFDRFQELLEKEQPDCGVDVRRDLVPAMKHLIQKSMFSVRKTIDPLKRKYCFELFGYDFILDEDFNTWLIEVNTNPCLEESSQMLKQYLPRMLEDMLKITIDQIFPKISKKKRIPIGGPGPSQSKETHSSPVKLKNRKHSTVGQSQSTSKHVKGGSKLAKSAAKDADKRDQNGGVQSPKQDHEDGKLGKAEDAGKLDDVEPIPEEKRPESDDEDPEKKARDLAVKNAKRIHPVPGYSDTENMWEKLLNLERTVACPPPPTGCLNNKNRFNIAVQDKIFKIKKNPSYQPYHKQQEKLIQQRIKSACSEIDDGTEALLRTPGLEGKKSKGPGSANESLVASAQRMATAKLCKADGIESEDKKIPQDGS